MLCTCSTLAGLRCFRREIDLLFPEPRRDPVPEVDAVDGGGRRRDVGLEVLEPAFGDVGDGSRGGFAEFSLNGLQWALLVSNQRPLPCEGSALPLS
jgi:hypothetical protein